MPKIAGRRSALPKLRIVNTSLRPPMPNGGARAANVMMILSSHPSAERLSSLSESDSQIRFRCADMGWRMVSKQSHLQAAE